jgi:hypothetical protein
MILVIRLANLADVNKIEHKMENLECTSKGKFNVSRMKLKNNSFQ